MQYCITCIPCIAPPPGIPLPGDAHPRVLMGGGYHRVLPCIPRTRGCHTQIHHHTLRGAPRRENLRFLYYPPPKNTHTRARPLTPWRRARCDCHPPCLGNVYVPLQHSMFSLWMALSHSSKQASVTREHTRWYHNPCCVAPSLACHTLSLSPSPGSRGIWSPFGGLPL